MIRYLRVFVGDTDNNPQSGKIVKAYPINFSASEQEITLSELSGSNGVYEVEINWSGSEDNNKKISQYYDIYVDDVLKYENKNIGLDWVFCTSASITAISQTIYYSSCNEVNTNEQLPGYIPYARLYGGLQTSEKNRTFHLEGSGVTSSSINIEMDLGGADTPSESNPIVIYFTILGG